MSLIDNCLTRVRQLLPEEGRDDILAELRQLLEEQMAPAASNQCPLRIAGLHWIQAAVGHARDTACRVLNH